MYFSYSQTRHDENNPEPFFLYVLYEFSYTTASTTPSITPLLKSWVEFTPTNCVDVYVRHSLVLATDGEFLLSFFIPCPYNFSLQGFSSLPSATVLVFSFSFTHLRMKPWPLSRLPILKTVSSTLTLASLASRMSTCST